MQYRFCLTVLTSHTLSPTLSRSVFLVNMYLVRIATLLLVILPYVLASSPPTTADDPFLTVVKTEVPKLVQFAQKAKSNAVPTDLKLFTCEPIDPAKFPSGSRPPTTLVCTYVTPPTHDHVKALVDALKAIPVRVKEANFVKDGEYFVYHYNKETRESKWQKQRDMPNRRTWHRSKVHIVVVGKYYLEMTFDYKGKSQKSTEAEKN